jgi:hypothetical protein
MDREDEEWGPWIDHDGKRCPFGELVWIENEYGVIAGPLIAGSMGGESWLWDSPPDIIRIVGYKIKKPKGLKILEGLLENLPTKPDDLIKEKQKEYEYVER